MRLSQADNVIHRGVALAFAELGARIAICDINVKGAEEVSRMLR